MSFGHLMLLALVPVLDDTDGIISSTFCLVGQNEVQHGHVMLVLASHDTDGIINGVV